METSRSRRAVLEKSGRVPVRLLPEKVRRASCVNRASCVVQEKGRARLRERERDIF